MAAVDERASTKATQARGSGRGGRYEACPPRTCLRHSRFPWPLTTPETGSKCLSGLIGWKWRHRRGLFARFDTEPDFTHTAVGTDRQTTQQDRPNSRHSGVLTAQKACKRRAPSCVSRSAAHLTSASADEAQTSHRACAAPAVQQLLRPPQAVVDPSGPSRCAR